MNPSDEEIIDLLKALDLEARRQPYPPLGLDIYGMDSNLSAYILIVRKWVDKHSPEAQR